MYFCRLEKGPAHLSSPYGLLRSPWNYNPTPHLVRFGNVFRINDTNDIGPSRDTVFKFHMGVNCTDYRTFFKFINGKSLERYLISMEDDTHGIFHFTLGGVGGDNAAFTTNMLIANYGFTASNIAALSVSAQHFFKKHLALSHDDPVNCSSNPWQDNKLFATALPGAVGGPLCDFSDRFYESEYTVSGLVTYFFNYDPDEADSVVSRITSFGIEDQQIIMRAIANMFPVDGDLAGSGAGTYASILFFSLPFSFLILNFFLLNFFPFFSTILSILFAMLTCPTSFYCYFCSYGSVILGGTWCHGTIFPKTCFLKYVYGYEIYNRRSLLWTQCSCDKSLVGRIVFCG